MQEDPVTFFGAFFQQVLSLAALTLPEGYLDNLLIATRLSNLLQCRGWIGSLAEHEDDWKVILALINYFTDTSRTGSDKLFVVHPLFDKITNCKVDTIRTEAS